MEVKIYLITNTAVNPYMYYVGLTKFDLDKRLQEHVALGRHEGNKLLSDAIIEYGKRNFTIEVIEEVDESEARTKEDYYIRKYKSHYRDGCGYNMKYEKLLSFYPLFLIIIGTLCNLTSFIVLRRKSIRKYACMKYLSVLAISDMSILYSWNFNSFFKYNFSKPPFYLDLEELSLVMCKLIGFSAFFCLQLSAWLLSLVSFDRLMLVYSTKWKHFMHKPHRIHFVIAGTILTILCLNIHILFLNGYIVKNDLNFASFALQNPSETKTHLYGELITSKYSNTQTRMFMIISFFI
jgi:hypothetical protein